MEPLGGNSRSVGKVYTLWHIQKCCVLSRPPTACFHKLILQIECNGMIYAFKEYPRQLVDFQRSEVLGGRTGRSRCLS